MAIYLYIVLKLTNQVASSVLTHSRVIKLRSGGREQDVGDVSWLVPDGVDVTDDMSVGDCKKPLKAFYECTEADSDN